MKLVKEHINEKFKEESDPIRDLGIGFKPDLKHLRQDLKNIGIKVSRIGNYYPGFNAENKNNIIGYIEGDKKFNIYVRADNVDNGQIPIYHLTYEDVMDIFPELDNDWIIENDSNED